MRGELHHLLGEVVSARISLDSLQKQIILDLRSGIPPVYRGYLWGKEQFDLLEKTGWAIEAAFLLLKTLTVPEGTWRIAEAEELLAALRSDHVLESGIGHPPNELAQLD